jgi:hypothetical protein
LVESVEILPSSAMGLPGAKADPTEVHFARLVFANLKINNEIAF